MVPLRCLLSCVWWALVSPGWYQLTSAGVMRWFGHKSLTSSKPAWVPHQLVLLARFRAAEGKAPKCTSTLQSSACVMFAIIQLVKASHMIVPSIWGLRKGLRTGGNWGLWYLVNLLHSMRYRRWWREAKEFLVGSCTRRPETNKSRWTLKVREPREKDGSITLITRFVSAEITWEEFYRAVFRAWEAWVKCWKKTKQLKIANY